MGVIQHMQYDVFPVVGHETACATLVNQWEMGPDEVLQCYVFFGENSTAVLTRKNSISSVYVWIQYVLNYFVMCEVFGTARVASYDSTNGHGFNKIVCISTNSFKERMRTDQQENKWVTTKCVSHSSSCTFGATNTHSTYNAWAAPAREKVNRCVMRMCMTSIAHFKRIKQHGRNFSWI